MAIGLRSSRRRTRVSIMAYEMYSDVVLVQDVPASDLRAGDIGTVVERHVVPELETGYSVEFFDMTGRTVAVITVPESPLRAPSRADRPAVRVLTPG
jgi:hypothetical protein